MIGTDIPADTPSPWKGLDFYVEADAHLFFGRDKESRELQRFVRRETLTVLFGPSGTGKSSLLHAGLFPRLREENYLPIPIRRLQFRSPMPLAQQAKALIRDALTGSGIETEGPVSLDGDETLWEYLHRSAFWNSRNELVSPVLVFDQFEEVFTLGDHLTQTDAFLVELADLVENYVPARLLDRMRTEGAKLDFPYEKQRYKVIVALRDDYVHRLDGLRSSMPSIMRNRYVLKRMGHKQAMAAVLGPGGPQAIVDERVARAIVDWVSAAESGGGGVEVEPAILSLVCRELDRRRRAAGHASIRLEDLRESQTDILLDYYEESFQDLDPKAREFVEDRLITASGFRTAVPLEETKGMGDAIEALMQRRLIRSEERLGIPHLELSHDRLTDVVLASRKEREHREEKKRKEELREQEEQRRLEANEARWRRQLNGVLAGALFVSLVAVALAFWQAASARASQAESDARTLATQARQSLGEDPERSLMLGLYSAALTRERAVGVLPLTVEVLNRALALSLARERYDLWPDTETTYTAASAAFRRDQQQVAVAQADGKMTLWNLMKGEPETVEFPGDGVSLLVLSADGTRFGRTDGSTVQVRDIDAGQDVLTLSRSDLTGEVSGLALTDDGTRVAVAIRRDDRKGTDIGVWDAAGSRIVGMTPLDEFREVPPVLAFSGDGRRLAATYHTVSIEDQKAQSASGIEVWDVATSRSLCKFDTEDVHAASLALSFDGQRLAASLVGRGVSRERSARAWNVGTGEAPSSTTCLPMAKLERRLESFPAGTAIAFSPASNRSYLAMDAVGGAVTVWDLESEIEAARLVGHTGPVLSVRFAGDDRNLSTIGTDGTARVWRLDDALPPPGDGDVKSVAVSPDGKSVAILSRDKRVRIVPPGVVHPDDEGLQGVESVVYSRDGDLATAGENGVRYWYGSASRSTSLDGAEALAIAVSPDGKHLAASTFERTLTVWDTATKLTELSWKSDTVCEQIVFDPAGTRLAAYSCWDNSAAIWELGDQPTLRVNEAGSKPPVVLQHRDRVNSFAFSDDETRVATSAGDGRTVTMWDWKTQENLFVLTGHDNKVSALAFRPRGGQSDPAWLATTSVDGTVRIWDVSDTGDDGPAGGTEIMILDGHRDQVSDLAFAADGKRLVTAGQDGTLRRYVLDVDELIGRSWTAVARRDQRLTDGECRNYLRRRSCDPPDVGQRPAR